LASEDPNLQNIPIRSEIGRQVRQAFVARTDRVRYCLDYSQIELRMLAHLSQDPLLLKIYYEGLDAHHISAVEAFGTGGVVDGIDMRRIAKILNFGVSFGMTKWGLMGNVNKSLPEGAPLITEEKAQEFIDKFDAKYAGIGRYKQRLYHQIAMHPRHEFFNLFGRPRRLGDGFRVDAQPWQRRAAERHAVSTDVQGSTADLVKHSMVAVWKYIKAQTTCEASMVLMIHDDVQLDMGIDGSARCVREVKRLMEQTCQSKLCIPIVADVEYFTTHWADKHKMKGL
jgi:DNA polymerase-1